VEILNVDPSTVEVTERWPIHRKAPAFDQLESKTEMFETGLKVVDPADPVRQGRQDRSVRWCGRRQDRPHPEMIMRVAKLHEGVSVFAGVGERTREGNDLIAEMEDVRRSGQGPRWSSVRWTSPRAPVCVWPWPV